MPDEGWLKRRTEIIEQQVRDYNEGWALRSQEGVKKSDQLQSDEKVQPNKARPARREGYSK